VNSNVSGIETNTLLHGRRKGVAGGDAPVDFEFPITFLAKKFVFLVSSGRNEISPTLLPLDKSLLAASGPIHYCPPLGKNPSDAHAWLFDSLIKSSHTNILSGQIDGTRNAATMTWA